MLGALTACDDDHDALAGPDDQGTLFFTRNAVPNAYMDALCEGRVVKDSAGCLRLSPPEAATLIWPVGWELMTRTDGTQDVVNTRGEPVGRVGGSLRLGGGFVPTLHDGTPLSDPVRKAALTTCPGMYWLVAG